MLIMKVGNCFWAYESTEDGDLVGIDGSEASTPLAAARKAASTRFATGSYYWHMAIAQMLLASDAEVLNH